MREKLKELVKISHFAGGRVDYTQGGGGNTSVKLGGRLMAIKASGYRLTDITEDNGYVTVDYEKVVKYYREVDLSQNKDFEAESNAMVKDSIRMLEGMKSLRPSVEVGFHALLKDYVIHIHSVYAAIVVCNKDGERQMEKALKDKDYGFIFVPYINPGFSLSLEILNRVDEYQRKNGATPEAIFMKNHGLVVHSDSAERAMRIVDDINGEIMKILGIKDGEFKEIKLETLDEGSYASKTPLVLEFLAKHKVDKDFFDSYPLYPDQLVYLNNCLANTPDKMRFEGGKVIYSSVSYNQAVTMEETLAAFLFVLGKIWENNLPLSTMGEEDVDFINNWEAEKFRRSIVK
jgi:rhamnose utilization protein RhaD (predicted bifunctional aldolase and dehydrogenase)